MVKVSEDKNYLLEIVKAPFNTILQNSFKALESKEINNDLLNWFFLKLNILLKNNIFRGDLTIEKNVEVSGLFISRTYDLVIKSKSTKRILLVITLHKVKKNNANKTIYSMYKNILYNTLNLGAKNIPYYSLFIAPLNTIGDEGQTVLFNKDNLFRIANGNKSSNVSGITKVLLVDGNVEKNNLQVVSSSNVLIDDPTYSNEIDNSVLLGGIKQLFPDIYNILQKYQ